MNTRTTKKVTSLRLTQDLYKRIKNQAKKENRSVNNYIENILLEKIGGKIEMTKAEYKGMLNQSKQSTSYSLNPEEEKKLFDELL
ncbi:Uncharacterised protein [Candidatus Ornithobacterium hominis]|uniref:Toxin-antitoxin system HicB family antitoxin n=1 Tax=Candidatus Ornithobacterium hominis TaxID=2497989 RepID=A0A383TUW8_9FLAO|nr:toxin-antitoxin system HicB family antitoxin [Candidatus Ornithobacterium hominis]MCT7904457.1 toxin-antitoxin system HicB family antitoxin [Candidatus Ornithobacterium hominis]CAI9430365.1 Toxin-antitoxin system HicB family antitoxin [Candidatus Ornithobacterium hominis]SZD71355.1 Uncharacterised protein [Candidatus Ornithobacterium hominis]